MIHEEDENKKLWNGTKKSARIVFTIAGKKKRMHFAKDVIRVLGGPTFVCLKVNQEFDAFLITPCDSKQYMSFQVPYNYLLEPTKEMDVVCKSFVDTLLTKNGLDINETYLISGTYIEKNNAVVFQMADVIPYSERTKLTERNK